MMIKNNQKLQSQFYTMVLCIAGLSGILYYLIIQPGHPHDSIYWVYRIGAMADEVKIHGFQGFPYRVLCTSYEHYGYGAPLFYSDIFLVLPALFTVAGLSAFHSLMIYSAVIWCLRIYIAYFSACKFLEMYELNQRERMRIGTCFALLYCFFPYMLEVMIRRGSMGEAVAGMFLPLIGAYFVRVIKLSKEELRFGDVVYLALGLSGVILSHVITTYLIGIGIVLVLCFLFRKLMSESWRIIKLLQAAIITLGVTAFWLFPFLEQFLLGYLPHIEDKFLANGLSVKKLFIPCEVEFAFQKLIFKSADTHNWYPSMFFYMLLFATVAFIYVSRSTHQRNKIAFGMLCLSWILTIVISLPVTLQIVKPVIGMIQFPWRLLSFIALLLAIVISYLCFIIGNNKFNRIVIVLYVFCGLMSVGINMVNEVVDPWTLSYSEGSHYREELYIPVGANTQTSIVRGEIVVADHSNVVIEYKRNTDHSIRMEYGNIDSLTTIELPLFYYKGYRAVDDNGSRYTVSMSRNGLVQIELPESKGGSLRVYYAGTMTQRISEMISMVSWICVIIFSMREKKTRNKAENEKK